MKKTVIINLRLESGARFGTVKAFSAEQALNCLDHFFGGWLGWQGEVQAHKVVKNTLVATLVIDSEAICDKMNPHANNALHVLSKALKQESIAYYTIEEQKGYCAGEWGGAFKPELFLI